METAQHISATMLVMGAAQGMFLSVLLIGCTREHDSPNRMLGWALVALSTGYLSISGKMMSRNPVAVGLFNVLMLAMIASVPLMYLYVRSLVSSPGHVSKRSAVHFLPLAVGISCLLVFNAPKFDLADNMPSARLDHQSIMRIIWAAYSCAYIPAVRRLYYLHARGIVELHETLQSLGGDLLYALRVHVWIRLLLNVCGVYWLLNIVSLLCPDERYSCLAFAVVSLTGIYLMGFMILHNHLSILEMSHATTLWHAAESHGGAP